MRLVRMRAFWDWAGVSKQALCIFKETSDEFLLEPPLGSPGTCALHSHLPLKTIPHPERWLAPTRLLAALLRV